MVRQVRDAYQKLEYLTTTSFLVVLAYYLFLFTPNVQVNSRLYVAGTQVTFINWSYKTRMANVLCDIPSQAMLVFIDQFGNAHSVNDTATLGTGDVTVSRWEMTATIPPNMEAGPITVFKRLRYPCTLGVTKTIDTASHIFTLDNDGLGSLTDDNLRDNRPNN